MNVNEGLDGLTQNEAKLASYHNTPFTKICLGMRENDVTNWILVNYPATSLYSLIADGNYLQTNAGRAEWMSLINDVSLQENCNREGFNVTFDHHNLKLRIGIVSNNENDCDSCDSVIGFGIEMKSWKWSSGNIHIKKYWIDHKKMTFGYIFVQ